MALRRSCHETIKLPVWFCVLVGLLLLFINYEIRALRNAGQPSAGPAVSDSMYSNPNIATGNINTKEESRDTELKIQQATMMEPVKEVRGSQPLPAAQSLSNTGHDPGGISEGELDALAQILEMRMAQGGDGIMGKRHCSTLTARNNTRGTCQDTDCHHHFHPSPRTRIQQLLATQTKITPDQLHAIHNIAKDVTPKKYFFVTAASSNHYNESQALVYNMRRFVFSKLHPDSYTFFYFDLGLKPLERRRVEKNCNCTVMPIRMQDFPAHSRHLMCYAWKPFIIKALLPKTEVLVYVDASIRFRDMDIDEFFSNAKRWGAQFLSNSDSIPNHTVQSMFDYYKEPACLFWPFPELLAGFSVFHNEPFMSKVVIDPWVSCALNKTCMCPVDPHAFRNCAHQQRRVGDCHRFDLSSLTLQMAKLYVEKFGQLVLLTNNPPKIRRGDRMGYFTD